MTSKMSDFYISIDDLTSVMDRILSDTELSHAQMAEVRGGLIDKLVMSSQFGDEEVRSAAQRYIRILASLTSIKLASLEPIYRSKPTGFTVPALNIRTLTYDVAQCIFKLLKTNNSQLVVFELAISEQEYTYQSPWEYAAAVVAAAIKVGYEGPIYLQGDHYQLRAKDFHDNTSVEITRIQQHILQSIEAGFYNIDIDGSTLVDLDEEDLFEQQRNNYEVTATLTRFIRKRQPQGHMLSIGGEIGHIGGKNSTIEDFHAFMKGYSKNLPADMVGINKVAVQTGTQHGGMVNPDGSLATMQVDIDILREISDVARNEYDLGGAVQHGASTLPDELFHVFPENGALEIHLATGWQNIIAQHLPDTMKKAMHEWLNESMISERSADMTDEQFMYRTVKKAWGPFKQRLWEMSDEEKKPILEALTKRFDFVFHELGVYHTNTKKHDS